MSDVVSVRRDGDVAVVTIDNPPVNAMSHAVRSGVFEAMASVRDDPEVKAVVLACAGRTFSAGADITEFGKTAGRAGPCPDRMDRHAIEAIDRSRSSRRCTARRWAAGARWRWAVTTASLRRVGKGRHAGGEARPAARRGRHAAAAAPGRCRARSAQDHRQRRSGSGGEGSETGSDRRGRRRRSDRRGDRLGEEGWGRRQDAGPPERARRSACRCQGRPERVQ